MSRYVNMKANIKSIQAQHGTHVAALVMRLRGNSLKDALYVLVGRK